MRLIMTLILGGALAISGCSSDDGSGGSGGSGAAGGSGGAGGMGGMGGSGGGGNEAPVITMVTSAPDGSCSQGTASDYTITVTATDDSTAPGDLVYEGSVAGCQGDIDAASSTIGCPNAAPYQGSVVVRDEGGLASVPVNFTVAICESTTAP